MCNCLVITYDLDCLIRDFNVCCYVHKCTSFTRVQTWAPTKKRIYPHKTAHKPTNVCTALLPHTAVCVLFAFCVLSACALCELCVRMCADVCGSVRLSAVVCVLCAVLCGRVRMCADMCGCVRILVGAQTS